MRVGANASLEEIAKKAGVGPGTLYRHFPTREDLLVAVYRSEMEKLALADKTLPDSKSPVEGLRAWLLLFVKAWRGAAEPRACGYDSLRG